MVDRIPFEFRSNAALFCLFDELFPGQVWRDHAHVLLPSLLPDCLKA